MQRRGGEGRGPCTVHGKGVDPTTPMKERSGVQQRGGGSKKDCVNGWGEGGFPCGVLVGKKVKRRNSGQFYTKGGGKRT